MKFPIHIIYYDGDCGFCNRAVQWIMEHDHNGDIYFAALQSPFATEKLANYALTISMDTIIFESDGVIYQKSDAILRILEIINKNTFLAKLAKLLPIAFRTWGYDLIAKHRHRFYSSDKHCKLPTSTQRKRFLDN